MRTTIKQPATRIAGSAEIRLLKDPGERAGIVVRQWKRGILEVRGTQAGTPAEDQGLNDHKGWLVVGVNSKPVWTSVEIGELMRNHSTIILNMVLPEAGEIPEGKAMSKSQPSPRAPSYQQGSMPRSLSQNLGKYKPGDRVEVYYGTEDGMASGVWHTAEVVALLQDGTYVVQFETGEETEGVPPHSMRFYGSASPTSSAMSPRSMEFRKGDRVEVFYGPQEDGWFAATVGDRHRDGSYTVTYDTGEISEGVTVDYIRSSNEESTPYAARSEARSESGGAGGYPLSRGSQAEVLWEGRTWTPCIVKAYQPSTNTYDVDWFDGTETIGVLALHIRSRE